MELSDFLNMGKAQATGQPPTAGQTQTGTSPITWKGPAAIGPILNGYNYLQNNPYFPTPTPGLADTPGSVNAYGVPYNSGQYATTSMAAIARSDWSRFMQYYQPLEQKLAGMIGNNSYDAQQINTAKDNFSSQFDASQGQFQRDLNRFGLTMTPQEQQSYKRLSNESRALGQVNAINSTNRGIGQMEMNILGGSSNNPLSTALQTLPPGALAGTP